MYQISSPGGKLDSFYGLGLLWDIREKWSCSLESLESVLLIKIQI